MLFNSEILRQSVGLLAGSNNEGVVFDSSSSGRVKGDRFCGGLIGFDRKGLIRRCDSAAEVIANQDFGQFIGYKSDD